MLNNNTAALCNQMVEIKRHGWIHILLVSGDMLAWWFAVAAGSQDTKWPWSPAGCSLRWCEENMWYDLSRTISAWSGFAVTGSHDTHRPHEVMLSGN